jgi:hypothetical protein
LAAYKSDEMLKSFTLFEALGGAGEWQNEAVALRISAGV